MVPSFQFSKHVSGCSLAIAQGNWWNYAPFAIQKRCCANIDGSDGVEYSTSEYEYEYRKKLRVRVRVRVLILKNVLEYEYRKKVRVRVRVRVLLQV